MLRSGHRWQDSIKIALKYKVWLVVDWIQWRTVVNTDMNLRIS